MISCNVLPSDVGGSLPVSNGVFLWLYVMVPLVLCLYLRAVWVCVVLLKGHGGCVSESTSRSSLLPHLHLVTPN